MAKRKSKAGTRKSTLNKTLNNRRRKGIGAVILPWFKRFGLIVAIITFIIWLGAWFFLSDANNRLAAHIHEITLSRTAVLGFRLENILLEGRSHSDPDIIMALLNMEKGDPLFAFDPASAKAQIEKITWVQSARVERRWPDTIYIELTERTPLALFQHEGRLHLLDTKGEEINAGNLKRFENLIIVSGKDASKQAPELMALLLAETDLFPRIKRAELIGERRWDIILKDSTTLKMPEDDLGLALRRLMIAQEENGILDKDLKAIDLRKPDRLIIRTKPGQVQEYKSGYLSSSKKSGNNI
ncbi:MAG: cell division protein FtsQ/DivIB [Alphaproteobacteria bacterium]